MRRQSNALLACSVGMSIMCSVYVLIAQVPCSADERVTERLYLMVDTHSSTYTLQSFQIDFQYLLTLLQNDDNKVL